MMARSGTADEVRNRAETEAVHCRNPRYHPMYHLPSLYDILHTPGTAEDVTCYERIARRFGVAPQRWLEPGCGSGRHLRVLAGRGYRATGFDRDAQMVAYAQASLKNRGLQARVFSADMERFAGRLGRQRFDLAINPFSTIRHLMSDRAMQRHFSEIANALRPGGIYLVGISLANYARDRLETDLWLANRGRCHLRQEISYRPASPQQRIEQVESRLRITRPSGEERLSAGYPLRSYSESEWSRLVKKSALLRRASLDEWARPREERTLPYQLEVLQRPA